ncbi:DUF5680 domain-containing protein [Clostridium sp. 'White wine YQ']|uniref:DUF5680 domain-containing protein n=1 Tax=Clostridium sp. 'White wine YQ' TaxID=3027474 RepID=UPI0023663636|nr:DUF5680 domain-containing protein [Clostridium sp. 'White wine YQ']MDD7793578.1 DUF5680 domain-containing protein [Clostridium sp. 'White wine YQ']
MSFGAKLQELRKEKGLSQELLSEYIGVSRQAVAKWEIGQSYPDIEKLISISDIFKVSIDKLVKSSDDPCGLREDSSQEIKKNEKVIEFLCKAKKKTYAGRGAEVEPSRPSSHDLRYIEGNFKYIDTYLGGRNFAGEEAIWQEDVPIWSMNYIGRVLSEEFSGGFLKEVLSNVNNKYPYRGPLVYENGEYKYHAIINGEFSWFQGYEEIYYNHKKVYECFFHGGNII